LRRQPATTLKKLLHNVRVPARDVNIVPSLVENSLLSTSKFADAGYTTIYDENEVNFYDTKTTKILIEEDITVRRTANGLGESFFGFTRYLPRRKSWRKDVAISTNKRVLETDF
jgi:hypothetical protein